MSIDPSEHSRNRNLIEGVLRHIPGFGGYLEKECRRDSDRLQREWLAERLERSKRALDRITRPLADAGQIDVLPRVDHLRSQLDRLIARIRGAMRGYSGFFDLVKIDQDVLERVYEFDADLLHDVDALAEAVEGLPTEAQQIADKVAGVEEQVVRLDRLWDGREDILKGLA